VLAVDLWLSQTKVVLPLQVSFVGMTEEQAREKAQEGGWADKVAVQKTSFKANSKALAEKESEGIAKMIYRCD